MLNAFLTFLDMFFIKGRGFDCRNLRSYYLKYVFFISALLVMFRLFFCANLGKLFSCLYTTYEIIFFELSFGCGCCAGALKKGEAFYMHMYVFVEL